MDEALIKRIMPHSIEAEQSVIGSMIMDKDAIMIAVETVSTEDFYGSQYGILFETIRELYNEDKPVDIVTLQTRLREKNVQPELAGLEFIREIIAAVPTSANIRYYANIVKEKSMLRQLIKTNEEIAGICYTERETIDEVMNLAEKRIFSLTQSRAAGDFVPINQVVVDAIEKIEAASKAGGSITGIPTGFNDLDLQTAGMQPSDLILIAARPSMGKTAFVLNLAQHMALRKNVTTAIFSLEMSKVQLVNRMLSLESKVDAQNLRTGNLEDSDWERLIESAEIIGSSRLIIDDTPSISISELRSKCRKYKMNNDLGVVIIDYLQLMTLGGRAAESKQLEVSEISRSLKAVARELNVPVIALSQLSRAVEQRPDHRPMLSDLRDSGAIEQDADVDRKSVV